MGFITADRNLTVLFPLSLDEYVDKDAKVRYIVAVIDKLNLSKLYEIYSAKGIYCTPKEVRPDLSGIWVITT